MTVRTRKKQVKKSAPRIGVVVSKFNEFITESLLEGCLDELSKAGVPKKNVSMYWVPGSFELPVVALKLAKKRTVNAVICLGAVIKGDTSHYDFVCQGATQGIMQAGLMTGKPVIFGVLTTETIDQAYKRSEKNGDNKGRDCAVTALEMIETLSSV